MTLWRNCIARIHGEQNNLCDGLPAPWTMSKHKQWDNSFGNYHKSTTTLDIVKHCQTLSNCLHGSFFKTSTWSTWQVRQVHHVHSGLAAERRLHSDRWRTLENRAWIRVMGNKKSLKATQQNFNIACDIKCQSIQDPQFSAFQMLLVWN